MQISKVQYQKYFLKVVLLCTWVLCFCRILLQQYECSFWPNKCRPAESITQYKDTSKQTMQEKFQDKLWLICVWAPMWFKNIWMLLWFQYMCSKNFHICQNMATMWVPYSYRSVILVYNLLPNFPLICLQNYFFWPHRQILNECFGRHCLISVPLFPLFCVRRTFLPFTPDMGSSHTFHIFAFPHFHVSKFLSVSGFSYWLAPHIYAKFINTGHFHFGN